MIHQALLSLLILSLQESLYKQTRISRFPRSNVSAERNAQSTDLKMDTVKDNPGKMKRNKTKQNIAQTCPKYCDLGQILIAYIFGFRNINWLRNYRHISFSK